MSRHAWICLALALVFGGMTYGVAGGDPADQPPSLGPPPSQPAPAPPTTQYYDPHPSVLPPNNPNSLSPAHPGMPYAITGTPNGTRPNERGRYQMFVDAGTVYVMDTGNATIWSLTTGGQWIPLPPLNPQPSAPQANTYLAPTAY